jgi:hypothetical protein
MANLIPEFLPVEIKRRDRKLPVGEEALGQVHPDETSRSEDQNFR